MILEIKGLKLHNYEINMTVFDNEKLGVYSRNKQIRSDFLEILSGINKNNETIFVDDKNIFDNTDYFSKRVYFDLSKKYLTTLRVSKIEDALKNYKLEFDKDKFIGICRELNIRGETDITYKYEFTDVGNSFVNLAFIASLNKKNIIVNNPTANLRFKSDFDYFVNLLTSSNFDNVILGMDNLEYFKNKLNRVVIFSDYDEVLIMHNSDTLIAFDGDIDKYFLIKNKVFKGEKLIALNNYTKEELRVYQKSKVNFEIISIYDIDKYLGEV